MSNNEFLNVLSVITPTLPALVTDWSPGKAIYATLDGQVCEGNALFYDEHIAVQRSSLKKGSAVPRHHHDEIEWLIIYDGEVRVEWNSSTEVILGVGQSIRIPPNEAHIVTALEDTQILCITVPPAAGYPRV